MKHFLRLSLIGAVLLILLGVYHQSFSESDTSCKQKGSIEGGGPSAFLLVQDEGYQWGSFRMVPDPQNRYPFSAGDKQPETGYSLHTRTLLCANRDLSLEIRCREQLKKGLLFLKTGEEDPPVSA
jgi:hypothetical protein